MARGKKEYVDTIQEGEMRLGRKSRRKKSIRTFADGTGSIKIGRRVVRVMRGEDDVTKWTDDELIQGFRVGQGSAHPPNVVPIQIYQELMRRVMLEIRHRFAAHLEYAVEKHLAIIRGIETYEDKKTGEVKAVEVTSVQLKAIEMIYDRVLGKPEERVNVDFSGEPPWKRLMAEGIVADATQLEEYRKRKELEAGEIVEGEIVEEGT